MRRRGVYLILVVLVVVGVLLVVFHREREPEYGGKKLSEWVEKLPVVIFGKGPTIQGNDTAEAEVAVRYIGTAAVPYLAKWIRYEQPPWKAKFCAFANPTLARIHSSWKITDSKTLRAERAPAAFYFLGYQARGAIPELTRILNDRNAGISGRRAVFALRCLGNSGLPPLLGGLTSKQAGWLRFYAPQAIEDGLGTNAVPFLIECLTDPDPVVRDAVTNALRAIRPQALERGSR